MRRILAAISILTLTGAISRPQAGGRPWTQTEIRTLSQRIDAALSSPVLRGAQVGLEIVDTARGTVLYARNQDEEFMPASNFKLLTGSAALARLGNSFSFETAVYADAPPRDGVVSGNLYLRGGGDAKLSAADLDAAAAALSAAGVRRINGALLADATRYDGVRYAPGWLVDDLPYYYAAAVSALELEEGVVHVTIAPALVLGAPVTVRAMPQSDTYTLDNRIATGPRNSKDTSDIVRPWNAPHTIQLVGSYPMGERWSDDMAPSVPDPPAYAADVFLRSLEAHGITVDRGAGSGAVPASALRLWDHRSSVMPDLLGEMWIPSDNLMAELFLKELGVGPLARGSYDRGIDAERAYLRSVGVDPETAAIYDGSGLSAYDRITPQDLIAILQADWSGPQREEILDALPVAGVRGTLKDAYAGTPAEGAVFAKTGTWTHVTTLSGYAETRTHGAVTFSFLINNWTNTKESADSGLARVRGGILSDVISL